MTTSDILAQKRQQAQGAQKQQDPGSFEENKSGYINRVEFSGSLGRETEYIKTGDGRFEIAKNGIAVFNPGITDKEDKRRTKWIDLTMFLQDGDSGKFHDNTPLFVKFLSMGKGQKVVVRGRLSFRYWKDKSGQERETAVITVEDIE